MARGKYTDRARTKKAADLARGRAEDELRKAQAEVRRLGGLARENSQLRDRVSALERDVEDQASERVRALEDLVDAKNEVLVKLGHNYATMLTVTNKRTTALVTLAEQLRDQGHGSIAEQFIELFDSGDPETITPPALREKQRQEFERTIAVRGKASARTIRRREYRTRLATLAADVEASVAALQEESA